jgi:hypothetical protein
VIAVRDRLGELGDALPIVITFADDPARLAAYRAHLGLAFPVVADVDRTMYRRLGADRGTLRQVWSPGTLKMYARLVRSGRRLTRPAEDTRQLGADAVVGRDGRLGRVWLPHGPDHRPHVDELVEAVALLQR